METNIISRPAIIVVPSVSQFARGSINLVPLTSKLLRYFPQIFWRKVSSKFAPGSISCVCAANDSAGDVHPSPGSPSSSLKPQIVEISQNLLLMLLPNAFSLPAGQKSTSEITLLFWRRDEDARSQRPSLLSPAAGQAARQARQAAGPGVVS